MSRRAFIVSLCLLASPAAADVFNFETPSGNIDCSVGLEADMSDITCVIHERGGDHAMPRPAGCSAGWGHIYSLRNSGRTEMRCGDPGRNLPMYEVAPYGVVSHDWNGLGCSSTEKGLECHNADGHGFFLSRRVQRVF